MSSAFHDPSRWFPTAPRPPFVAEVAPAAARGALHRDTASGRGAAPPSGAPLGGRHACASDEADFLLQVTRALAELRAAIARWRAAPSARDLRRGEVERCQDALVALLWGASRTRLSHNEWRVVERLLDGGLGAARRGFGGARNPASTLA